MRRCFCLLAVVAMLVGCGGEGEETASESPVSGSAGSSDAQVSSPGPTTTGGVLPSSQAPEDEGGGGAGESPGIFDALARFAFSFGSLFGEAEYTEDDDLDEDGVVGLRDFAMAKRALAGLDPDPSGEGTGGGPPPPGQPPAYQAARPFSNSQDCKFCHPRQFNEWRTSPHAYSGISPTFYSLVAAGQNSFGAGVLRENTGTSVAGGVGNFCLPCHAPIGFLGLEGRYGGNNGGFADVQPQFPIVCAPGSPINPLQPCTTQNSVTDCGAAGLCTQFEGRTCVNSPPVDSNSDFPRQVVHCAADADCPGNTGPCVIAPATIYYNEEAQEGINCEVCHNVEPNHQRSCQLFRQSDSVGVFSFDLEERETPDGRRLRLGPYPVVAGAGPGGLPDAEQGLVADTLPLVANAFHESARVDTPLVVPHNQTDRADPDNPAPLNFPVIRPTAVTCEELPYCGPGGFCQGGPLVGTPGCLVNGLPNDRLCGGCGFDGAALTCGGGARAGLPCENSVDCASASNVAQNLLERGIDNPADETVTPLSRATSADGVLDRPDGNYYRSSMMCGSCHDVRPPFVNAVLKSCQEQPTHVCSIDSDCLNLDIGCSGNDCGPCVAENAHSSQVPSAPHGVAPTPVDMGNAGYRRVENLFSEWQISLYNHPDLTFCRNNSFSACTPGAEPNPQCMRNGVDEGPCDLTSPYGKLITCQDCHTSNFPLTPLIDYPSAVPGVPGVGVPVDKNSLYPVAKAALEGSQSNPAVPIPMRRVSTHFMAGVDLPLVKYPGQAIQQIRRQQLIDSGFKISVQSTPATATAGQQFEVHVTVENVGVGHRFPSGFSHERQNWLQLFVQEESKLFERGGQELVDNPFLYDPNDADASAPCHLQGTIATSAEDTRDPVGAFALENAGCIFRSGFQLDKAHPETGEMTPDGSLNDEDPEDFFVVPGTRVRGFPGDPRIEVRPGAEGGALDVQYICEESTSETYRSAIAAGSGIDVGTDPSFPFQARFCDPSLTPASGPGHTAPGFGNPDCLESGGTFDVGPCVPEIELSDGNERGRCAHDISRGTCQDDADCGGAGPCLFRCSGFPELECCDSNDPTCAAFYGNLGLNECELESQACLGGADDRAPCLTNADCSGGVCAERPVCVGGSRSGLACDPGAADLDLECPLSGNCGNVGPCNVENSGIVNFQNQFRTTANGVCVDPNNPRTAGPERRPIPLANPITGLPSECFLNLQCTLQGFNVPPSLVPGSVAAACLVNGQCSEDAALPGEPCTNLTSATDCPGGTCNVEFNLELNGRPSESVFIQNHPYNFNSMPPFQEFEFLYDFEVPPEIAGEDLVVSVRLFNRHFPMRFLRNLIGTQTIRPPFISESQGDASDPNQCNDPRTIDIDCFERPVVTLGQAEPGGFIDTGTTRWRTNVSVVAPTP